MASIPRSCCNLCLKQLGNALCQALVIGGVEKVNQLVALADTPDFCGVQYSKIPLHGATGKNSTEAAKLLLERGDELKSRDVNNRTPLHDAAYYNSTEAAKLLLENGA